MQGNHQKIKLLKLIELLKKTGVRSVIMVIATVMLLCGFPLIVFATSGNTEVAGTIYENL